MARIEDYAIIGNCETAALVGRDGSIDWLCLPRFDSESCFSKLLGDDKNGRWLLAPKEVTSIKRRYLPGTLVLETTFANDGGSVRVLDFMPPMQGHPTIVRIVESVEGSVEMTAELVVRFDSGTTVPWVNHHDDGSLSAVAGPHLLLLHSEVPLRGRSMKSFATFRIQQGQRVRFALTYQASWLESGDARSGPGRSPPRHGAILA